MKSLHFSANSIGTPFKTIAVEGTLHTVLLDMEQTEIPIADASKYESIEINYVAIRGSEYAMGVINILNKGLNCTDEISEWFGDDIGMEVGSDNLNGMLTLLLTVNDDSADHVNFHYIVELVKKATAATVEVQYRLYTDGAKVYRRGARNGEFMIDVELTPLGFRGVENTDWENVKTTTP